jgi:Protein of unknown function (DUF1579)
MRLRTALPLSALLIVCSVVVAQAPPMPKPGAEQKKLEYFVGNWKTTGEVKPGPMGPGGKFTGTTKAEMMEGGFFLVMNSELSLPGFGNGKGLAIMGYSSETKQYTYHEVNSWGEQEDATGTVDGDTWTWNDEHKMGDVVTKGRYTMKVTSPTSYDFKYEVSTGGEYATAMEGKSTK